MKECKNIIGSAILIFLFQNCNHKESTYELSLYRDGMIRFISQTMSDEKKESIERGDFIWTTTEGDTLVHGKYADGFKIGNWMYQPTDNQKIFITWDKYKSPNDSLSISLPKSWKILNGSKSLFLATFESNTSVKDDKYFVILNHNSNEIDMNMEEYWTHSTTQTFINDSIRSYLLRKFVQKKNEYYFSTYTVIRKNEELFVMNFIGEIDSNIYEITYSTLKENVNMNYVIFLDMVRSIRIGKVRFFTPFDEITIIKELKWPYEQRKIS